MKGKWSDTFAIGSNRIFLQVSFRFPCFLIAICYLIQFVLALEKLTESGWKCIYLSFIVIYGILMLWNKVKKYTILINFLYLNSLYFWSLGFGTFVSVGLISSIRYSSNYIYFLTLKKVYYNLPLALFPGCQRILPDAVELFVVRFCLSFRWCTKERILGNISTSLCYTRTWL